MHTKHPKHTGIYNICGNIDYLEIEVHFRHINSLLILPKLANAPKKGDTNDRNDNVTTIARIRWQQKLLSPSEVELYKDERNCITETQRKYNQWLHESETSLTETSNSAALASGGRKLAQRRKRKVKKLRKTVERHWGEIFTYVQEDNYRPISGDIPMAQQSNRPTTATASSCPSTLQQMYVFAAITPNTQLLELEWDPQLRQLRIYPDFNEFDVNPYYIEIDTDYRHLYAYAVRNVSRRQHTPYLQPNLQLLELRELPDMGAHWQEEGDLCTTFAMPPKRTTRVILLFELRTACGFSYDNIHVRYHIKLPANTLLEEGVLDASTHASSSSHLSAGKCFVGYTWQLTLLCEEDYNPAHLLHIYFEVVSIDSWERERIEGYAHYCIYLLAGCDTVELHCLRATENLLGMISRYLIGGRRKFDFMHFYTEQSAENDSVRSRYGCRMESTGVLELTCQRFTQRNCELLRPCHNRTNGMTLDDIMLAYREARKRLQAVALK